MVANSQQSVSVYCIACLYVSVKPNQRRPIRVSNINCFLELKFSSKNIKEIHISVEPLLFLYRYNNLLLYIERFHVQCSFCQLPSHVVHSLKCVRMPYMGMLLNNIAYEAFHLEKYGKCWEYQVKSSSSQMVLSFSFIVFHFYFP